MRDTAVPRLGAVRTSAPFIVTHDVSRGILHAVHSAIQYALMLAIMCVCSSASSSS